MLNLLFCCFQHTILFLQLGIRLANDGMLFQPDLIESIGQRLQCLFPFRWFQFALPDGNAMPTHLRQPLLRLNIPFLIPFDLRHPKLPICIRYLAATLMPMPKAPIHKNTSTILFQHQIRMPRQSWRVKPISKSLTPEPFTHNHLWLRILTTNRRHRLVSLLWGEMIHHLMITFFIVVSVNVCQISKSTGL